MGFIKGPKMNIIINVILVVNLSRFVLSEVFTAISDCENLVDSHKKVIDDLDNYIKNEERRISGLKQQLQKYKSEHEKATEDIPNYMGNPLNIFTLVKRLTVDLSEIEKRIELGKDYLKNMTISLGDMTCPTEEDLAGVASALRRLQATYKLDVKELADGILNNVAYSTPLSAGDCFELGKLMYKQADYKNSIAWMKEALKKYNVETNKHYLFTEIDIYDSISYAYYLLDDPENAIDWLNKLVEIDPNHIRRLNMPMFEAKLEEILIRKNATENIQETEQQGDYNTSVYEALCRGDLVTPHFLAKRLKCFYKTDSTFLKLAPIKTEQLYEDPDVFIFHEVMSDGEIEFIKDTAKPRFERAHVFDLTKKEGIPSESRISKLTWLDDSESEVIAKITRRISDFTGLAMKSAEQLQVANYGIGGHYIPHYDYFPRDETVLNNTYPGRRIATVLFYMSEVAQGGATVFTELGISVFPIKKAALFWLNLHPSCEGNKATMHAACPVLRGSKWVANKWIRHAGQEFIRPCTLEYQPEEMLRTYPRPIPKD